jgi:hypothetical protein
MRLSTRQMVISLRKVSPDCYRADAQPFATPFAGLAIAADSASIPLVHISKDNGLSRQSRLPEIALVCA